VPEPLGNEAQELFDQANALYESGHLEQAAEAYRRSIEIEPERSEAHNNLGNTLLRLGKAREAIDSFDRALQLQPNNPQAFYNRGIALHNLGQFESAVESCRRAVTLDPAFAAAWNNLGTSLQRLGKLPEALGCLQRAIALTPDSPAAHNNLGSVLQSLNRFTEACDHFQKAIALNPNSAEAHNNLGNALRKMGRAEEAMACYRNALRLRTDSPDIYSNLGNILKEFGRLDHALACYERALQLSPQSADVHNNLANTFKEAGQLDEAIACYRKAMSVRPDLVVAHSGLAYTMHFHPEFDAATILEEHKTWNLVHARRFTSERRPFDIDRSSDRPLRIGYVSPDFRDHVVGRLLLPLLENHDRSSFEVFCYADVTTPDSTTERLQKCATYWQVTFGDSDAQLAQRIRDDRIDILVDLTMHMAGNRLLAFARRPAPVQATYLAYCSTTGLEPMDWRLTDPYLDPPGMDAAYTERSYHLPRTYWCYQAPPEAPEIAPLPAESVGHITFGSLNNFCKVSRPAMETWAKILLELPTSRLILHAHEGVHRQRTKDLFASLGVSPDRIEFVGFEPMERYLGQYHRIDIALDSFPYAGGTTTFDALWMGTPVITLNGKTAVGRGGASILSNLGLSELIASDLEQYIQIALKIARDPDALKALRQSLRQRMRESPLMDAAQFARDVETAYQQMWQDRINLPIA